MPTDSTTQANIVEAGIFCFRHFGYKGTTIDMIARKAGVGKGTLYNYFADKEALLAHITDMLISNTEEATQTMFAEQDIDESWFYRYLMISFPKNDEDSLFGRIFTEAAMTGSDKVQAILDRMQQRYFDKLKLMVTRFFESRNLKDADPELTTFLLLELFGALTFKWPQKHEPLSPERILEIFQKLNPVV